MSDQQSGLNAPVQQPAQGTPQPQKAPAKPGFGQRPFQSATPAETQSNFHAYKFDDGEEIKFKTPDDLNRYIREGTLRHKDYTKKTQETAELRKQIEKEREQNRSEYQAGLQAYNQWKATDDWLKQNQRVVEIIRREGGPVPQAQPQQAQIPDELKSELEDLKKWRQEQEQERLGAQAMEALSGQYEDFSDYQDAINQMYSAIEEAPEGQEARALYEILYYAAKGKNGVAAPQVPVTPGGRVSTPPSKAPFDEKTRDKFAAAKKAMRGRL